MTTAFIADCGHSILALPEDYVGGTGYGLDAHGKTRCYESCAEVDRAQMLQTSRAVLYFVILQITNWPALCGLMRSTSREVRAADSGIRTIS
jgi:hypothetical protein